MTYIPQRLMARVVGVPKTNESIVDAHTHTCAASGGLVGRAFLAAAGCRVGKNLTNPNGSVAAAVLAKNSYALLHVQGGQGGGGEGEGRCQHTCAGRSRFMLSFGAIWLQSGDRWPNGGKVRW